MNVWKRTSNILHQALLLCVCLLLGGGAISEAATLHIPGFVEVNQYSLPAGIPGPLGGVMFSDDGNTLYILGGSESNASGAWTVPVIRNTSGTVTGLGAASQLFAFPQMDTGLEIKPGTDTLFFRINGGEIGERRPDGSIASFLATGASFVGGLAFVPDPLPNAGDLLVGNYNSGVIHSHSLTDNSDDTFTPVLQGFYSNSAFGATGDLNFIPSGIFANDLMYTNWNGGTVSIIDIDPLTGIPVGGGVAPTATLFASGLGSGPWGLEFDPITGDLFISNFAGNPFNGITQISGFPPPATTNGPPTADAGADQLVIVGSSVNLDGSNSSDPDSGDTISYQWTQVSGTSVTLSGATSAMPSFDAPAVGPGGDDLVFSLVVTDDDPVNPKSSTPDEVTVSVRNINDPPSCDLARASCPESKINNKDGCTVWPPNHKLVSAIIEGVMDTDSVYNEVTLRITGVTQDEPVNGGRDGDTSPDAVVQPSNPADSVQIRAERTGLGGVQKNGRVYVVSFTADDGFESCTGSVTIGVPHDRKDTPVDDGQLYHSTQP